MKNILNLIIFALLMSFVSGCLSVDYSGMKLREQDPTREIIFYNENQSYPEDLAVLGRATIITRRKVTLDDIEDSLMDKADEVGASGIKITKFRREKFSQMAPQISAPANPALYSEREPYVTSRKFSDLGPNVEMTTHQDKAYTIEVHALMLADRKKVNSAIERAEAAREKFIAAQAKQQEGDRSF